MICVRLMGGLGNQMFQYAAGRSLAVRHGTVLKLDRSYLQGDQKGSTKRQYLLDKMMISAEIALPSEIPLIDGRASFADLVRNRCQQLLKRQCSTVLSELGNRISSDFFRTPDYTYLMGYWQSPRYFEDIADIIRADFMCSTALQGKDEAIASVIKDVDSVSLHIRRGDYLLQTAHGVCSLGYYEKCVDTIAGILQCPHFFIFSDDAEWVRQHLFIPFPHTLVDHNPAGAAAEDLRLMSLCKHNIIANSSFSWWGAWLNSNSGKRVFAPARWFADERLVPEDLIPPEWEKVE